MNFRRKRKLRLIKRILNKEELNCFFFGNGYVPIYVEGHEPMKMHEEMIYALDTAIEKIHENWKEARENNIETHKITEIMLLKILFCIVFTSFVNLYVYFTKKHYNRQVT